MSRNMIRHDYSFNMADSDISWVPPRWFNGQDNSLIIPSFHLDQCERERERDSSQTTPHKVEGRLKCPFSAPTQRANHPFSP